jgi:hypothetical protein
MNYEKLLSGAASGALYKILIYLTIISIYTGLVTYRAYTAGVDAERGRNAKHIIRAEAQRAENAIGAATSLAGYIERRESRRYTFDQLISQFDQFAAQVQAQAEPTVVYRDRATKEVVNVPVPTPYLCSSDFVFDAGELRLFNYGNKRSEVELGHPGGVPEVMPEGPSRASARR